MKRTVLFCALVIIGASAAYAQRIGDQGIGLMVGNPSGLSYKMWFSEEVAVDAAAGVDQSEFDVHATVLWHNFDWWKRLSGEPFRGITDNGDFPLYFGVGPRVLFEHNVELGVRVPVGLSFFPRNTTWEFFGELAPVLRLTPDTGVDADFAIGFRYYFPAIRSRSAQ